MAKDRSWSKQQTGGWKKRSRRLDREEKKANTRAKYGPAMRPAEVVTRSLETGEVMFVGKPISKRQRSFIVSLRRQLGISIDSMPATSREASQIIDALVRRKETLERDGESPRPLKPGRRRHRPADGSAG